MNVQFLLSSASQDSGRYTRGVRIVLAKRPGMAVHPNWIAGITLKTIQRILGHRSLKTTSVYLHVTHENDERLLATLDRLMAKL